MEYFKKLARKTQKELKNYVFNFLSDVYPEVVSSDGYVFAKGEIPVLLVAHLDTVHHQLPLEINTNGVLISSPQGIGGDDRCGVWIINRIVGGGLKPHVVFCEDEEVGLIGAGKFSLSDEIKTIADTKYIIELDRKGENELVYYYCGNKKFQDYMAKQTGYKTNYGSCSDITKIAPAMDRAAVNMSVGYYDQHTLKEKVNYSHMRKTFEVLKKLLEHEKENPTEKPFLYEKESFSYSSSWGNWGSSYTKKGKNKKKKKDIWTMAYDDAYKTIEVYYYDEETGTEEFDYGYGATKEGAWFDFFSSHPYVRFADVIDFSWIREGK